MAPSGHIYERNEIESYLRQHGNRHPESGDELRVEDLIPLKIGDGKKMARRMIDNADTSNIDNSILPNPVVMFVALVGSIGAIVLIALGILFKLMEHLLLVLCPLISLVWGLLAVFHTQFVMETLKLDSSVPVQHMGALVALASWGAFQAGRSGCAMTKGKFLVLAYVISTGVAKDFQSFPQAAFYLPLFVGVANLSGPRINAYLHQNQKDSVQLAQQVQARG